jgi:hypothetical protein
MRYHFIIYVAIIVYSIFLPIVIQWNEFRERRDDLENRCKNYHGNIQAFLERCYLFEKGMAEENAFQWQDAEYQWIPLLVLLIEPGYLLLKKIHFWYLCKRDHYREQELIEERKGLNGLTFQSIEGGGGGGVSNRIRYF